MCWGHFVYRTVYYWVRNGVPYYHSYPGLILTARAWNHVIILLRICFQSTGTYGLRDISIAKIIQNSYLRCHDSFRNYGRFWTQSRRAAICGSWMMAKQFTGRVSCCVTVISVIRKAFRAIRGWAQPARSHGRLHVNELTLTCVLKQNQQDQKKIHKCGRTSCVHHFWPNVRHLRGAAATGNVEKTIYIYMYNYVYIYIYICVCMCVKHEESHVPTSFAWPSQIGRFSSQSSSVNRSAWPFEESLSQIRVVMFIK